MSMINPAPARNGPKGMGADLSLPWSTIIPIPITAPTSEESMIVGSRLCQPIHAPKADSNLKSP